MSSNQSQTPRKRARSKRPAGGHATAPSAKRAETRDQRMKRLFAEFASVSLYIGDDSSGEREAKASFHFAPAGGFCATRSATGLQRSRLKARYRRVNMAFTAVREEIISNVTRFLEGARRDVAVADRALRDHLYGPAGLKACHAASVEAAMAALRRAYDASAVVRVDPLKFTVVFADADGKELLRFDETDEKNEMSRSMVDFECIAMGDVPVPSSESEGEDSDAD